MREEVNDQRSQGLSECVEVEFDDALTIDKEVVYIYIVLSDSS